MTQGETLLAWDGEGRGWRIADPIWADRALRDEALDSVGAGPVASGPDGRLAHARGCTLSWMRV